MSRRVSFTVSEALHEGLDRFARLRNCSKNVVVVRAIEDYLSRHEMEHQAAEGRRQSMLVASQPEDDQVWLDLPDTTGWE